MGTRAWFLPVGWLVAMSAHAALAWSHRPAAELSSLPGFEAALSRLGALPNLGWVTPWPPEHAGALHAMPATLPAAAALPIGAATPFIALIGPRGFSTPPELTDAAESRREIFESVELGLYLTDAEPPPIFDLRRDLDQVEVSFVSATATIRCDAPRAGGGKNCPGRPEWNYVGPTSLTVGGVPWPCVWAHPAENDSLVLRVASMPLGDVLRLEAALTDDAARTPSGTPVLLELHIGDAPPRRLHRPNSAGIVELEVPTTPGHAEVRLNIRTSHAGRRHLGINLRSSRRAAPAGELPPP